MRIKLPQIFGRREATPPPPPPSSSQTTGSPPPTKEISKDVAYELLQVDFEQAFELHNSYKDAERELYQIALKIIALPIVVAGAILSAGLISSTNELNSTIDLPVVWYAAIVAGLLDTVIVRAYIVTDRVQTESKHQVNALRSLYLTALREQFPDGWQPVWGSTNKYLATKAKLKSAVLTAVVLSAINAAYLAYGIDRALLAERWPDAHAWIALSGAIVYFLFQLEYSWDLARKVIRR